MKLLLPTLGCVLGCSALLASIQVSAQNKARVPVSSTPAMPKPGPQRAAYANRVNASYNDLKPLVDGILITFDDAQESLKITRSRTRPSAPSSDDFPKLKADLLASIAKARPDLKRMRSISPVPRSLKRADTDFIDGSLELEQALDTITLWSDHPINEWKLRANRLFRKGLNDLDSGQQKLAHLTDPSLVGKVYVDG